MIRLSDRDVMLVCAIAAAAWIASHDVTTIYHRVAGGMAVRYGFEAAAQHHFDIVVDARKRSTDGWRIAEDLVALSTLYRQEGHLRESKRELERALELLPADPLSYAATRSAVLSELTGVYQSLGLLDQALASSEGLLVLAESRLGAGHLAIAEVLEMLATVHAQRGSLDLAETVQRRALSIREAGLGSNDPEVALAMAHLGHLLLRQGRFRQSELYLDRSVTILRAAIHSAQRRWLQWPENRSGIACNLARSLNDLGILYREQGRVEEARMAYAEALELTRDAPAERVTILTNASSVLMRSGHVQEALIHSSEALAISNEVALPPARRALIEDVALGIRREALKAESPQNSDAADVLSTASNARKYPMLVVTRLPRSALPGRQKTPRDDKAVRRAE